MRSLLPGLVWTQDLPVCFPGRPCVDYVPLGADVINATSALTPVSEAIAIGCFVLLGVALVLVALALRPQPRRLGPSPWLLVQSTTLFLIGVVAASAANARLDATSSISGPEGAPAPSLIGSWPSIGLVGDAIALLGYLFSRSPQQSQQCACAASAAERDGSEEHA